MSRLQAIGTVCPNYYAVEWICKKVILALEISFVGFTRLCRHAHSPLPHRACNARFTDEEISKEAKERGRKFNRNFSQLEKEFRTS
jgi:hypothetical protein